MNDLKHKLKLALREEKLKLIELKGYISRETGLEFFSEDGFAHSHPYPMETIEIKYLLEGHAIIIMYDKSSIHPYKAFLGEKGWGSSYAMPKWVEVEKNYCEDHEQVVDVILHYLELTNSLVLSCAVKEYMNK